MSDLDRVSSSFVTLDTHPVAAYLSSLAPGSRRTMQQSISVMAHLLTNGQQDLLTLRWQDLRYQHALALRSRLQERYAPATVVKMLSALRRVLKEARRLGLMSAEDYDRTVDIPNVKSHRLPKGRFLEYDEVERLFACCFESKSKLARRDAAMLAVLYGSGLRRDELVKLNLSDLHMARRKLQIKSGKGDKDRIVFLPIASIAAIQEWLRDRGNESGPLFTHRGNLKPLDPQVVYDRLKKISGLSEVTNISPHDFRRTFISNLFDEGVDGAVIRTLAGHADFNTTIRYDRRGDASKLKAVDRIQVPYKQAYVPTPPVQQ